MNYDEKQRPCNDAGQPLEGLLSMARDQMAHFAKDNPSREMSIAITKVDEAFFWMSARHAAYLAEKDAKNGKD